MSKLYFEVLDKKRADIFKKLSNFKEFLLAGGTGLSLQIGHRKSYDFDLSSKEAITPRLLIKVNDVFREFKVRPTVNTSDELTLVLDEEVKLSFYKFPFSSLHKPVKTSSAYLYSIADLASNKVYVVGRRAEWKDYVDLYFILRKGFRIEKILKEAKRRFGGNFDEKLFWQQLVYWKDLSDFEIEYLGKKVKKEVIQGYFKKLVFRKFG